MDDFKYLGEFTLSTSAGDGDRYLTVQGDSRVLVTQGNRGENSVFRLYCKGREFRLTTRPLSIGGRTQSARVNYWFNERDETGLAYVEGYTPPTHYVEITLWFESEVGAQGGQTNIVRGNFLVGCKGAYFPGDRNYFHLGNPKSPFRPNPWRIALVRGLTLASADMRHLDLGEQARCQISMTNCNLEGLSVDRAEMAGSDLGGSNLTSARAAYSIFSTPGKISVLDRTTWAGGGLLYAKLEGCSLIRANFTGAHFNLDRQLDAPFPPGAPPTNFRNANLIDAIFNGCDLRAVDFTGADLRGADFTNALMDKCVLTNAWLAGANFTGTNLTKVVFGTPPRFQQLTEVATDRKARFSGATLKAGLLAKNWSMVDLTGATVQEIPRDLSDLKARRAVLPGVDFTGCNLSKADFSFSLLDRTKFVNANLTEATLSDLDLKTAVFTGAILTQTKIDGADLSGLDLSTATATTPPAMSREPARRTKFVGATFKANLLGKDWRFLDLTKARFQSVTASDLQGMQANDAILVDVDLAGANFNPAIGPNGTEIESNFQRVLFHGADLKRTQFRSAHLEGAQFGALRAIFRVACAPNQEHGSWRETLEQAGFAQAADATIEGMEPGVARLLRSNEPELIVRHELGSEGSSELVVRQVVKAADISKAYLVCASLKNANLEDVIANGAHIYGGEAGFSKLEGALMSRIRLTNANLGTADLKQAHLRGANLQGANLVGAKLNGADLTADGNSAADLTGAFLSGADFTDAKLSGAVLTDAAVATDKGVHLFTLNADSKAEIDSLKSFILLPSGFKANLGALTSGQLADIKQRMGDQFTAQQITLPTSTKITKLLDEPSQWTVTCPGTTPVTYKVVLEDMEVTISGRLATVMVLKVEVSATDVRELNRQYLATHLMALRKGRIDILIPAFREIGLTLPTNATVADGTKRPSMWSIVDTPSGLDLRVWTRVYDLGLRVLQVQSACTRLRAFFEANQRPLIDRAVIEKGDGQPVNWTVDSDSGNPGALTPGYVRFNIVSTPTGYEVFGDMLRITRLDANNRTGVALVPMLKPTGLDKRIMDGDTCCPNGSRVKDQRTTQWSDDWLWAKTPPQPPKCVPSMHGYCPPEE